jgi:hypothetical protein
VKTEDKVALFVAGGAALVGGAWWWSESQGEDLFDMVADFLAELTTDEAQRMEALEPETQSRLRDLIFALGAEGIRVYVGQTIRTAAKEKQLIEAGKTSGNLVHSWHELGRAVDLYPIDPDTGKWDRDGRRLDLFQRMHAVAKTMGFRGIAFETDGVTKRYIKNSKGKLVWDGSHLECRGPYATMAQAWAAEGPSVA